MAEGKWVFTGFYSQLQVFVTAVPVLIMVNDDYLSFTVLKSLVICVGDLSTLAMVFVPKMLLVSKYHDFDKVAIGRFVAESLQNNSTQRDSVYERLRVRRRNDRRRSTRVRQISVSPNLGGVCLEEPRGEAQESPGSSLCERVPLDLLVPEYSDLLEPEYSSTWRRKYSSAFVASSAAATKAAVERVMAQTELYINHGKSC